MGGGSSPQTQTTKVILSPEQRELMTLAMPGIREYAANPPARYQGSQVAPFNQNQMAGQQAVLAATPQQQQTANIMTAANEFMLGNVLDPASNPALQATIDASVRPIYQGLERTALPAIRSGAEATGNFGSSRQGIAEGLAIGEASQAAGDTAAKVANTGYLAGLDAMAKGLALAPQTQQAQLAPGMTQSAVGDVQQAREQALINEQISNFNWDQQAPFLVSQDIMALLAGMPGGATQASASQPQQSSLGTALGAAATIGSNLLPLLSFMSDRNVKEDIKEVGVLHNGLKVYSFRYKGDPRTQIGLMADEVALLHPAAVHDIDGTKIVNYKEAVR